MDEMEQFERRLQELTPAGPVASLRRRIFNEPPPRRGCRKIGRLAARRIPLGWVTLLVLAAALAGYLAGRERHGFSSSGFESAAPPTAAVSVQIVPASQTAGNDFDFTQRPSAPDFLSGNCTVHVKTGSEVS